MGLADLPDEIKLRIANDLQSSRDKLNLALICKKWTDSAIEALQTELSLCHHIFKGVGQQVSFRLYYEKLSYDPSIGRHARRFKLGYTVFPEYRYPPPDIASYHAKMLSFTLNRMPKLEELELSHPIEPFEPDVLPNSLRRVTIFDCYGSDLEFVPIDVLKPLFDLPKLRSIKISTMEITKGSLDVLVQEQAFTKSSSTVISVDLSVGDISQQALEWVINAPAHLEDFSYYFTGTGFWSTPSLRYVVQQLDRHASTLRTVRFSRVRKPWVPGVELSGSLKHFTKMQLLQISLDGLLGWNHCEHLDEWTKEHIIPPEMLATLLPSSLHTLELELHRFHWYRNGSGYLWKALRSIVTDRERFSNLTKITIHTGLRAGEYCSDCEHLIWQPGFEERLGRLHGISANEHDAIMKMFNGYAVVSFPSDEHFWEDLVAEEDPVKLQ